MRSSLSFILTRTSHVGLLPAENMSTCDRLYRWNTLLFKPSPENGYAGIAPFSAHCLSAVSKILEAPKSRGHFADPSFYR